MLDVCVAGTVEEPETTTAGEDAVDGAADSAASVGAAVLAAGRLDVVWAELGVTPVPLGMLCCRL